MDPFICFIYFYILFSRWTMEFFNIIGLYTIQRRFFSSPLMMAINSDLMIVWGVGKRHFFGLHKLHIIGYSTVIYITHCVSWLFSSQKMESIRLLRSDGWWLQGTIDLRSAKNWGLWARMGNKKNKTCLVVWNHGIWWLSIQLRMSSSSSSSQLTNSIIFQRGRSTTNQKQIKISHFGVFRSLAVNQNYWFPLWSLTYFGRVLVIFFTNRTPHMGEHWNQCITDFSCATFWH